ncbi:MAG: hypothetical protein CVU72_06700 [Deltaproteobacteria bacterium HGW-Deltaproteobacteria-7]|nr:MAG: hypothetical protein CVU72_06700 [Deltaproteobacteria bacterium HGW-Deltaproteobacteria-7]PKN19045.1 MAG: hypothetical protein CVU71_09705 [Deltaproteobacteria bacterium HGW-Deltaproteobacteria-6]
MKGRSGTKFRSGCLKGPRTSFGIAFHKRLDRPSCKAVVLILLIHPTFQSEAIKIWLNSDSTYDKSIPGACQ